MSTVPKESLTYIFQDTNFQELINNQRSIIENIPKQITPIEYKSEKFELVENHRNIFHYVTNENFYTFVAKKISNLKELNDHKEASKLISGIEIKYSRFFIRNSIVGNIQLMDKFDMNLNEYLNSKQYFEYSELGRICHIIIRAMYSLIKLGYCYTDIKTEQVMIRKRRELSNHYVTTEVNGDNEIAVADLDFSKCSSSSYVSTYFIPSHVKTIEEISLFSLGITLCDILGADINFFYTNQKSITNRTMSRHIERMSSQIKKYRDVPMIMFIFRCLARQYKKPLDVYTDYLGKYA